VEALVPQVGGLLCLAADAKTDADAVFIAVAVAVAVEIREREGRECVAALLQDRRVVGAHGRATLAAAALGVRDVAHAVPRSRVRLLAQADARHAQYPGGPEPLGQVGFPVRGLRRGPLWLLLRVLEEGLGDLADVEVLPPPVDLRDAVPVPHAEHAHGRPHHSGLRVAALENVDDDASGQRRVPAGEAS
jgi:hypothetical protein